MLERIRELGIPPAWEDVWICPYPMGHIQATGQDAAGRKQYRYHDRWRERRDREKFDSMEELRALAAAAAQARSSDDLARDGMPRERVLACAARLLDRGFFRIGSEDYAEENETYGLATMQQAARDDRRRRRWSSTTRRRAASGASRRSAIRGRRGGARRSSAGAAAARSCSPTSAAGAGRTSSRPTSTRTSRRSPAATSAPRTSAPGAGRCSRPWRWRCPATAASGSKTARKRAKTRAVKEVARYLGNTPAVCRASYIDPRVFDRFDGGLTIGGVLPELAEDTGAWPDVQGTVEEAVLDLIEGDRSSDAIEKVA